MSGSRSKYLRGVAKAIDPVHWKIIYRDLKRSLKRGELG